MVDVSGGERRLTLDAALGDRDRLAALQATELLDSDEEPELDRLTRLAARILRAPPYGASGCWPRSPPRPGPRRRAAACASWPAPCPSSA